MEKLTQTQIESFNKKRRIHHQVVVPLIFPELLLMVVYVFCGRGHALMSVVILGVIFF